MGWHRRDRVRPAGRRRGLTGRQPLCKLLDDPAYGHNRAWAMVDNWRRCRTKGFGTADRRSGLVRFRSSNGSSRWRGQWLPHDRPADTDGDIGRVRGISTARHLGADPDSGHPYFDHRIRRRRKHSWLRVDRWTSCARPTDRPSSWSGGDTHHTRKAIDNGYTLSVCPQI
jgi:hypothetical protein